MEPCLGFCLISRGGRMNKIRLRCSKTWLWEEVWTKTHKVSTPSLIRNLKWCVKKYKTKGYLFVLECFDPPVDILKNSGRQMMNMRITRRRSLVAAALTMVVHKNGTHSFKPTHSVHVHLLPCSHTQTQALASSLWPPKRFWLSLRWFFVVIHTDEGDRVCTFC